MKTIKMVVLLFALANFVFVGCKEEPVGPDPPPITLKVSVWPPDSAANINTNVKPYYEFDREIKEGTMPEVTVVRCSDEVVIPHTLVKVNSKQFRMEFSQPLDEEERYERFLYKAIGKNGEILPEPLPFVACFSTQDTVVVITPLVLTAVSPQDGEEISHTVTTLTYSADYDLDVATVTDAYTLTKVGPSDSINPTDIQVSGKNIVVVIDGLLEPGSSYTAEFDSDIIRGLNGEKPSTTYSFSFSTTAIPLFTTPEGYLQTAGDFYDGKYYVGGYGPNDEGFVACFDWDGNMLWFKDFRINEGISRVSKVEVNSTGIYLIVAANPSNPISYELWLNRYSLNGESIDMWKLSDKGFAKSITSSESKIYLVWGHNYENTGKLSLINTSGIQAQVNNTAINSVIYKDGYVYTSAFGISHGNISVTKWLADLSDTLWVNEVQHAEAWALDNTHIIYASNRYWVFAVEFNQQLVSREIMQQYDDDGNLLVDTELSSITPHISDVCSDGINAYKIGADGLIKVDLNGNVTSVAQLNGNDVFCALGQIINKVAVADGSNELKLFSP